MIMILLAVLGVLMVSTIRYTSFKAPERADAICICFVIARRMLIGFIQNTLC